MIKGFAHVCLSATDLPAVERFYCCGLRCRKAFDFIRDGQVVGFYLELAQDNYIEIFLRDEIDSDVKFPISHFCLEVDDIDNIGQQLIENGYEATEKKLGADQSWQIWTTDPSGVRIEFHQYTKNSSQITHENCMLG
jgi:catechol 2,3-dioxygenase-like lactoylglutathione lyase family enzyme